MCGRAITTRSAIRGPLRIAALSDPAYMSALARYAASVHVAQGETVHVTVNGERLP